ncbi:MAG TPA: chemotaxis response regulator protein-glutamate methylesterase [Nitrospirota bacterium]|jgi:two-component system chemotaxis response regulator CheB
MRLVKVLVVDDSAYNRDAISAMLESSPFIVVAGTACDGEDAIEKAIKLKPDVITLDLEMPKMDGFTFLRWLMKSMPVPVIVVSSRADDKSVIRALEFGAVDFLAKPVKHGSSLENLKFELVEKVKKYSRLDMDRVKSSVELLDRSTREKPAPIGWQAPESGMADLVVIGASTGGPPAIQAILTRLPADFPAAIAVSQHMPARFTQFFAERLDKLSQLEIMEAGDGDQLLPGRVLIAPGGAHLTFQRAEGGIAAVVQDSKPADKYTPSVDIMMKSAAAQYGRRAMGVILTGMGNDGREGMTMIKRLGGVTLAESRDTAVIYGMPKEAIDAGVIDSVVPLDRMAEVILKNCTGSRK